MEADDDGPREDRPVLVGQATAVVDRAQEAGIVVRLIGGVAVALHSPSASHRALRREYADIDFVAGAVDRRALDELLAEVGYFPDKRFNSLHGKTRRLYFDESGSRQVDVFMSHFKMCHELPLGERLTVDSPTVPLAELFLTKAQIVQLNQKDLLDLLALLADHPVGDGDDETINADRVAKLCGADWGLAKTVTLTLDRIAEAVADAAGVDAPAIESRVEQIRRAIDEAPKSMRWRARARVGERVPWYELPEDPRRGTA
ncbi:MAG: hypothetical protein ABI611_03640 [Solirubrobacteraceae bacterium]